MSRNSKNARLVREAKERNRTKGYKGPARTETKHGKKNAWYQKFPTHAAWVASLTGGGARRKRTETTAASTDVAELVSTERKESNDE